MFCRYFYEKKILFSDYYSTVCVRRAAFGMVQRKYPSKNKKFFSTR